MLQQLSLRLPDCEPLINVYNAAGSRSLLPGAGSVAECPADGRPTILYPSPRTSIEIRIRYIAIAATPLRAHRNNRY